MSLGARAVACGSPSGGFSSIPGVSRVSQGRNEVSKPDDLAQAEDVGLSEVDISTDCYFPSRGDKPTPRLVTSLQEIALP